MECIACRGKHWILLPPDTPLEILKPDGYDESRGAVHWMKTILPDVQNYFASSYNGKWWMVDFIQRPGETYMCPLDGGI